MPAASCACHGGTPLRQPEAASTAPNLLPRRRVYQPSQLPHGSLNSSAALAGWASGSYQLSVPDRILVHASRGHIAATTTPKLLPRRTIHHHSQLPYSSLYSSLHSSAALVVRALSSCRPVHERTSVHASRGHLAAASRQIEAPEVTQQPDDSVNICHGRESCQLSYTLRIVD